MEGKTFSFSDKRPKRSLFNIAADFHVVIFYLKALKSLKDGLFMKCGLAWLGRLAAHDDGSLNEPLISDAG